MCDIVRISDYDCLDSLMISRDTYVCLCRLIEYYGGVKGNRNVCVCEHLTIFLSILAYHTKRFTLLKRVIIYVDELFANIST